MTALAVELDPVLGDTRPLWRAWLEDAARRYASIAPLGVDALAEDRGAAAAALDEWAARGIGAWRDALERYAVERAPVYLRPNADVSAALRRLQRGGTRIGVFTDAPEELARIALAQLGATRRVDALEAGAGALERLLGLLGRDAHVVRTRAALVRAASVP